MYYYIKGELVVSTPSMAVIDAHGVGYKMTISENTYRALPRPNDHHSTTLYTHLSVREDGVELFGFSDEQELSSFKLLLSVSGVGPKAAMSILSLLTPEQFALAVCTDDKKTISKASGIGPKTAARIILELRDKLMKEKSLEEELSSALSEHSSGETGALSRPNISEALDALLVLGYTRAEAKKALGSIDTQALSIEDIIKEALKRLMKK